MADMVRGGFVPDYKALMEEAEYYTDQASHLKRTEEEKGKKVRVPDSRRVLRLVKKR